MAVYQLELVGDLWFPQALGPVQLFHLAPAASFPKNRILTTLLFKCASRLNSAYKPDSDSVPTAWGFPPTGSPSSSLVALLSPEHMSTIYTRFLCLKHCATQPATQHFSATASKDVNRARYFIDRLLFCLFTHFCSGSVCLFLIIDFGSVPAGF